MNGLSGLEGLRSLGSLGRCCRRRCTRGFLCSGLLSGCGQSCGSEPLGFGAGSFQARSFGALGVLTGLFQSSGFLPERLLPCGGQALGIGTVCLLPGVSQALGLAAGCLATLGLDPGSLLACCFLVRCGLTNRLDLCRSCACGLLPGALCLHTGSGLSCGFSPVCFQAGCFCTCCFCPCRFFLSSLHARRLQASRFHRQALQSGGVDLWRWGGR